MAPYASLCTACNHLASEHRWDSHAGGTLTEGPYLCIECGCSVPQDGPFVPITRTQYESYRSAQVHLANPKTRALMEAAIERTQNSEPVPDDPAVWREELARLSASRATRDDRSTTSMSPQEKP